MSDQHHPEDHSHEHSPAEIRKHVQVYVMVFVALLVLTVVTVAVSHIELTVGKAVALALFIAAIKAGLVASYFMHLISEKKLIYLVLAMTVFFVIALFLLPIYGHFDGIIN